MDIPLEKLEEAVALAAEIERLEKRLKALFEPARKKSRAHSKSNSPQSPAPRRKQPGK
jgi:hypothetical protein